MNNKEKYVYEVFQSIAKGYDSANYRISAGLHMKWKRTGVKALCRELPVDPRLLDLGCGTGDMLRLIHEERPDAILCGVDFSGGMLEIAHKNLCDIQGVRIEKGNVTSLDMEGASFDGVTISFVLRNTADYEKVLREALRVLRPGGVFLCIDSFVPENRVIRLFYDLYFGIIMPVIGGGISKNKQYRWLAESTREFLAPRELMRLMHRVGFRGIRSKGFMFGSCYCIMGRKP